MGLLEEIIRTDKENWKTIIFTETKRKADEIVRFLRKDGYDSRLRVYKGVRRACP